VAENNSIKVGPMVFLVTNVSNHEEHYEKPCRIVKLLTYNYRSIVLQGYICFVIYIPTPPCIVQAANVSLNMTFQIV
jgi:hypothetical protein